MISFFLKGWGRGWGGVGGLIKITTEKRLKPDFIDVSVFPVF